MFVHILFWGAAFLVGLAFVTQALGIFYYGVVLSIVLAAAVAALFFWRKPWLELLKNRQWKIDWFLVAVVIISCLSLYQVHYHYTGQISYALDAGVPYHEVKNMRYPYPYFSDEWYSAAFMKSSIASHGLPTVNPLGTGPFLNLELFTHSFLAELALLLGLDPVTGYALLSIAINALIILLAYLFLRLCKLSSPSSALAALSMLYITAGANLPGIWHLIPITLGIVFIFMGFCFIALEDFWMSAAALFAASLFYPLLFPFYGLALGIAFYPKHKKYVIAGITAAVSLFLVALFFPAGHFIISKLFYIPILGDFIPRLNPFYIIPWPVIILAALALPWLYRNKKWLFFQIILGILYWLCYALAKQRVFLDYERVVFFTSLLACLAAGFGLEKVKEHVSPKIFTWAGMGILVLFFVAIPFYTNHAPWEKLEVVNRLDGSVLAPKPPANNYLTQDDLHIFSTIKHKKFLSLPWKGTVIGVATDNYPAVTKEGTVSIGSTGTPEAFWQADCATKKAYAAQEKIEYVYLPAFDCPGFEKLAESSEGLVLYHAP